MRSNTIMETSPCRIATLWPWQLWPAVGKLLHWPVLTKYSLDDTESNTLIPMPYMSGLHTWSQVDVPEIENHKVMNTITSPS